MKRMTVAVLCALFACAALPIGGQTLKTLEDMPKSDYSINIYRVYGFHQGPEGYKITYVDAKNEPRHLYLPEELRSSYRIYKPEQVVGDQNFLIIWKLGDRVERIEWFMPRRINYMLPNYVVDDFSERDRDVFQRIVDRGELVMDVEATGTEPEIRAPGGSQ
jgi:hypothetical protein